MILAAGEIVPRIVYYEQLKLQQRPDCYVPDELVGYRYVPDAESRICVPSIEKEFRINSRGFYGPAFSPDKKEGVLRIAIVGQSSATGIWLQGDEPFASVLQRKIDEAGIEAEVANFSIDGARRGLANLRLIESDVLDAGADVILLHTEPRLTSAVVYREVYRGYEYEPGHSELPRAEVDRMRVAIRRYVDELEEMKIVRLYEASFLFRAVHRWFALRQDDVQGSFLRHEEWLDSLLLYQTKCIRITYPLQVHTVEASERRVLRTRTAVERRGARLVFFTYEDDPLIDRICSRLGMDLMVLELPDEPIYAHEHDPHFNQLGHDLLGERLFEGLVELGYLPAGQSTGM